MGWSTMTEHTLQSDCLWDMVARALDPHLLAGATVQVQLGELIATGSFGVVHSGLYRGQHVAVKFLLFAETSSEEELNRAKRGFRQEVAVWHKLQHPNVVQVGQAHCARELGLHSTPNTVR